MNEYVNAYRILNEECIKFCEANDSTYVDIIAEICTGVLGHDFVYCRCIDSHFEFLTDWYEGGNLTILNIRYADDVYRKGFRE